MKPRSALALGATAIVGAALVTGNAFATPTTGVTTTILAKSTFGSTQLTGFADTDNDKGNDKGWFPKHNDDDWGVFLKTHGLTDGYVVDNVIAPGGTTGWHSHPGPSIIFVVRGTVTNYDSDVPACAGADYTTGSSLTDPGGTDVHMLKNNGTVEAETIAVQFLPTGAIRKIDELAPSGCPAS